MTGPWRWIVGGLVLGLVAVGIGAAAAGLLSVVTPVGEALLLAVAQAALQAASERRAEVVAAKFVS